MNEEHHDHEPKVGVGFFLLFGSPTRENDIKSAIISFSFV